jgi:hypothetical protein
MNPTWWGLFTASPLSLALFMVTYTNRIIQRPNKEFRSDIKDVWWRSLCGFHFHHRRRLFGHYFTHHSWSTWRFRVRGTGTRSNVHFLQVQAVTVRGEQAATPSTIWPINRVVFYLMRLYNGTSF